MSEILSKTSNQQVSAEAVKHMINDLRTPLTSINAWAGVLATESCEEVRFQGLQAIELRVAQIEQAFDEMLSHLNESKG